MSGKTIRQKSHQQCLLCGDLNPDSFRLRFSARPDGGVHAVFFSRQQYQGYDGMMHGGVISALLDAAMTHCLFGKGIEAVTAELQVRFLRAIPCNQLIGVMAEVVERRDPLFRLRGALTLDDCVMARSQARFIQRKVGS